MINLKKKQIETSSETEVVDHNTTEHNLESKLEIKRKEYQLSKVEHILENANADILNSYELLYDFYSKDSELYKYVEEVAKEVLGEQYIKVKIYIPKNNPQKEAFALHNGAIVITPEMIKLAKYKESLQAVIAHEALHVIDEHSKKGLLMSIEDGLAMNNLLRGLGIKRAGGHLADLYQHILATKNENLNPMGTVVLLENVAEYADKGNISLVHGITTDRALITEGVFYLYPFKNLTRELTEIPNQVIESIEKVNMAERINVTGTFLREEEKNKIYKRKKEKLKESKDEDLAFYIKEIDKLPKKDKNFSGLFKISLIKLKNKFFIKDEWPNDTNRAIGLDIAIKLLCNVGDKSDPRNQLKGFKQKIDRVLNEKKSFFLIPEILNDIKVGNVFSKHKANNNKLINYLSDTLLNYC